MAARLQFNVRNLLLTTFWIAAGFGVLAIYRSVPTDGWRSEALPLAGFCFMVAVGALAGRARATLPVALISFLLLAMYLSAMN